MGVPGLFANLHNKYKKNIIKKMINSSTKIDEQHLVNNIKTYILYFDFNCLIHPICHLLWNEFKDKKISNDDFENKVMVKTLEYMKKVIEYVKPTKCGIYIDGVCPVSKMAQQRQRRFASILDKEIMNNIRFKNGISNEEYYDTNAITPGTLFMSKLNDYITSFIKTLTDIEIIYSSYMEHGEGEHKIINHIKANYNELHDKNITIYGLDADLIILSLTLMKDFKIMLLREEEHVSLETFNMIFFDVNKCGECITQELTIGDEEYINQDNINLSERLNVIDDFIFITILLGNDFIPGNPTLNMRFRNKGTYGYDILMDNYKTLLLETKHRNNNEFIYIVKWLDRKLIINWPMFIELINRLASYEQQYFEHAKIFFNNKQNPKNKADEQIYHLENLMFSHPDPLTMHNKYIDYESVRKPRFIHHYFGNKVAKCTTITNKNKNIQSLLLSNDPVLKNGFYNDKIIEINHNEYSKIIAEYIKTFSYIMYYYYYGCPDNLYYYKPVNAILLSDLYTFLNNNQASLNNIINTYYGSVKHFLIHPLEQLLMVLPNKSFYLLPKSIEKFISTNTDLKLIKNNYENNHILQQYKKIYFPHNIKRDFLNKSKLFQAQLLLEIPPIDIIRGLIFDKKISVNEAKRSLINH